MTKCYHCSEPVPTGLDLHTTIDNIEQPMCCLGCQAVSQAIVDANLISYYKFRSEPGEKQTVLVPDQLQQFLAYDLAEVQKDFVHNSDSKQTTSLFIDGITCAACAWLIEHKLKTLSGVISIQVNSTTQRALVSWNEQTVKLSEILNQISAIGYQAAPYQVDEQEKLSKANSKKFLLRLGLAGFATMQVMMFALALYSGYFTDLELEYRDYFRWVSLIFAAPVVFYSAQPFYFSAIRGLLSKSLNMDLSVSIAIAGAYIASCIATINGDGEVYFESVTMFTFFLLLGRYFEQAAKQKASINASNLHKLVPLTASIVTNNNVTQIAAKQLRIDDVILVKPGEMIAADGLIIDGNSSINEAMLTGEHLPLPKGINEQVYAGTINVDQAIKIKVNALGQDQLVAEIIRLQEVATNAKPKIAILAERAASYFTGVILIIAALTYVVWQFVSPEDAFWVTLSVLVATCPCALALATPTAITCATSLFTRMGIITRKSGVFEKMPQIDHVVFDKTGTLTCGRFNICDVQCYADLTADQVLSLASALEQASSHPIAYAFKTIQPMGDVTNIHNHIGHGIAATWRGKMVKLGKAEFVDCNINQQQENEQHMQILYLCVEQKLQAKICIEDSIRSDAQDTVHALKNANIDISIASGDSSNHVCYIATKLNINQLHSGLSPAEKLSYVQQLQQTKQVAMFGDGINDAPVLAGSNLSVAMGSGSALAKNSADLILLGDKLSRFSDAISIAKKTDNIIKQNLFWALGYNVLIIPLAVTGHVLPYIAALGMSFSSIIVVSNSLRLLKIKP